MVVNVFLCVCQSLYKSCFCASLYLLYALRVTVPSVLILGPPASGKFTIGKMMAGRLQCPHLTMKSLVADSDRDVRDDILKCIHEKKSIPNDLWVSALKSRTSQADCERKGWVLSGFPQTREQARALQIDGVFVSHVVILESSDKVLLERSLGKRIDPWTDDVYHLRFDPPSDMKIEERLIKPENYETADIAKRLQEYHRKSDMLLNLYSYVNKVINADQPIADVFSLAFNFVISKFRSMEQRTPRIVLIGPPGCGKATMSRMLSDKYKLINLHCGYLIRQAVKDQSRIGQAMKNYVEKKMLVPDMLVTQLIKDRIGRLDCCTYGWILTGFPKNLKQAESLQNAGIEPSRVLQFDLPSHLSIERLTEKRLDAVTGDRYHNVYNPAPKNLKEIEQHSYEKENEIGKSQNTKSLNVSDARLIQHPIDSVEEVQRKITQFNSVREDLANHYASVLQTIIADQDVYNVFETCEYFICNPLPIKEN